MSASREEALSPDELRKRLYQTFKSKGLLDTLKTQLRNQLIQELKHPPLTESKSPASVKCDSGWATVCNSLVADYLRNSGYEYSLSVFNPECGLSKDKMLTKEDILQFVKIAPESSLYKALSAQVNCDKSLLMSLLVQLSQCPIHEQGNDVVTQTTNMSSYGDSLVEKMKMIDMEYDNHTSRGNAFFTLQSKLESYKKEIEERLQDEMKIKLQHFKDVELAKVQMAEKAKFNKEIVKLKHELEETYEMKTKALMEREKNAIARLQKQQEIEEKNVYMQRQEVLKEIEAVRNRESELRIKMEAFEKNCRIHEEKVKTTVELLRRREVAVKTLEDTHDQRLRNELSRYQLELKEEFVKRTEKLTENETRNKMETERLLKESAKLDAKLEEHVRLCSEIKELKTELDMAQQQQTILTEQKELLKEKLETMSNYTSLQSERAELQSQLRLLGKQLEEAMEMNSHLRADMQRIQSARRQAEEDGDKQKQVLQAQLQSEVERSAQLRAQLMECEEKAKWMNNHVDDIKMQLQQTQQALENEVLRNPKPSLVDRSILEICSDHLVPPDIYVDRTVLKTTAHYDLSKADGSLQKHTWGNTLESDMDLIADAKARMLELQREAETIEEAYRNYQQRAVVSNISDMLIPRPLSPQYPAPHPDSPLRRRPHRLLSPKATRTPPLTSYDTRKPSESQTKVTFLKNPAKTPLSGFLAGDGAHQLTEPLYERDGHFGDVSPIPAKRTSLPQESPTRNKDQKVTQVAGPLAALTEDAQLSNQKAVPSDDFLFDLSPPHSPVLRSTARDAVSPPKLKPAFSSSESSPQPEKISLEDLTQPLPEQSHIPELLLDTGVPEGPTVPRLQSPQDLQQDPPAKQSHEVAEQEDDKEQKWKRERKEREEQRLREQEEARERELQELERLEKEHLLQEEDQPPSKEEVINTENSERQEEQETNDDGKESKAEENPLEKYMKMVLEARETQQASPEQEANPLNFEDKSLSEAKDESIAAYSHKDEDDDFW
ncbi:centriole and centriolar satellite protein ofd1 [Periophthalmus magnuspinnatus]|uniref:centriole and centriolar satellite protein ofd1 n=1 Tax=Periophthalmus magnuspinnatus TaxID=409849 RepID=UPI0024370E49|nr:centriole and centriolar satellite protein ofd1 [Periophthalmus magnuspinnatus]